MAADDLNLDVLMGTLKDTTEYGELKKRIGRLGRGERPLDTPAARTTEERAIRKVRRSLRAVCCGTTGLHATVAAHGLSVGAAAG